MPNFRNCEREPKTHRANLYCWLVGNPEVDPNRTVKAIFGDVLMDLGVVLRCVVELRGSFYSGVDDSSYGYG